MTEDMVRMGWRRFTHIMAAVAMLTALAGCGSDGGDEPEEPWRYDFVTYLGYADGVAHWQYIGPDDADPVDLEATMAQPTQLRVGQRVLLSYTVTDSAHRINVMGVNSGNVASDSLRVNVRPVEQYAKHPIRLGAIWRTGSYINLRCEVEYTGKPRALYMMADRETLSHDTIDVHLIHDLISADTTYFWRTCYGSFYMGAAFGKQNCRAVRVHVEDLTYPSVKTYSFAAPKR